MPTSLLRSSLTICIATLGLCLCGMPAMSSGEQGPEAAVADQTPADFLDWVSQHTKARWRLLFRPPPPTPPTDRGHASLILGSLLADSFLVWQAGDSQQFRNNNQDVLSYCRMLGLGEKLMPRLMAQGKMAEMNEWKELRHEIVDSHQELIRMLREQRDDDLAVMIDLGLWLRMLEIVSTVVAEDPAVKIRPLCIGSPEILQDVREHFSSLNASKREEALVKRIGTAIDEISTLWKNVETSPPTELQVSQTHEKLKRLLLAIMTER
ncbi:hypothetical protein [Prosthecobacter sp.]|uniref:hypothetical protein n=1 Tax=Prosthecobacter sp. TaxID=1965333 RepID=UPI001DF5FA6C|nr:hypothetical protein [Prosthecobacter sp.]MCB1279630.1 hypothetical protein [Prosthecobacter sp.]